MTAPKLSQEHNEGRPPDIEVLVSDNGIVAYCRTCNWWNGPFTDTGKAQAWGERTHTTCEAGDVLEPT